MKQTTSFSSLPTGAHLHLVEVGETKFVFLEKQEIVSETVSNSLKDVQKELARTGVEVETGVERKDLTTEVVEKMGKEEWVLEEADRLQAEIEIKAKELLKEKFESIHPQFESILEKVCGPKASAEGTSDTKEWIKKKILEIESLPEGDIKKQKVAELQPLMKALNEEGAAVVEKEGFGKEWLYGSQNIETRIGNGLGAGLMTLYITGIVWGGSNNRMWYSGLIVGGAAAALPAATAKAFQGADWVLDNIVGRPIEFTFTKAKNILVGMARLDASQMWDGSTEINEERDEYLAVFYQGGILRPGEDAEGEVLIDGAMHNRILNPLAGEIMKPEQCSNAAKFCVSVLDPSVFLEGKDIPAEHLQELYKHGEWGTETRAFMQRRFATQETALIWNYFMLHADKENELAHFAKAFGEAFEEKRKKPLTKEEAMAQLQSMYPDLDEKLKNRTPEGIASFMKEGGLEDVLVALALFMGAIYTTLGVSSLARGAIDKIKNRKAKTAKEKYDKKRSDSKDELVKLMTKKSPKKHWKSILSALVGMSILNASEKKNLAGLSSKEKIAVIQKMKEKDFVNNALGEDLSSIKTNQDAFWLCVKEAGVSNVVKKRDIPMGKLKKEQGNIDKKKLKARDKLVLFQDMKKKYEAFRKTDATAVDFKLTEYKKLESFWVAMKKRKIGASKIKDWKDLSKDFLGKQSTMFGYMEKLGMHENEIKLCKDIPKKDGERRDFMMKKIDELLGLSGTNT